MAECRAGAIGDLAATPSRVSNPTVVVSAVALATFVASLSTSSLGVAVPAVSRHFHATALQSTLIVVIPSLTSTTLMLTLGRVGDLLGRRWCYLLGVGTFTVSNLLLSVAPTAWVFVGLQVFSAAGVAAVWANSAAILFDALDPLRLHRALGVYASAISVGDLVGPTIGGAVTQAIGWHGIFLFGALVGAVCLVWGWRSLPDRPPDSKKFRFDVVGSFLLILGLGGVVISLLIAQSGTGFSRDIVGGIAGAGVVLAFFVINESRVTTPLIHIDLFRNRRLCLAIVSGLLNAMAQWVPVLLMVLFLQALRGDTALRAGLSVMPLPVSAVTFAVSAGLLSRVLEPARLAILGSALGAVGLALLGASLTAPYPVFAASLVVVGAGAGIFTPANANAAMSSAPSASAGLVNGARLTIQNVGWVASTALALTLITAPLPAHLRHQFFTGTAARVSPRSVSGLLRGYHHSLDVLVACAVLASLAAVLSYRADVRVRRVVGTPDH
ncbi:MAG TPA: MFS transporter [Mycobacteriales bacterium]|nr:MFS transporter [Mycobacteriales bacterium]